MFWGRFQLLATGAPVPLRNPGDKVEEAPPACPPRSLGRTSHHVCGASRTKPRGGWTRRVSPGQTRAGGQRSLCCAGSRRIRLHAPNPAASDRKRAPGGHCPCGSENAGTTRSYKKLPPLRVSWAFWTWPSYGFGAGVGIQGHSSRIPPADCFRLALKQGMVFTFLNSWEKKEERHSMTHEIYVIFKFHCP